MKRTVGRRAAAAALGLCLVAGCGADSSVGGSTDDSGRTVLTWMMWSGGTAERDSWQAAADAVTKAHPDIRVKLETTSFDDYFTKIGTRMAAESSPCIVSTQSLRVAALKDGMRPLDDLIAAQGADTGEFDTAALEGLQVDGAQYGLPYDSGPMVMLYNKERFAEAGVAEPREGWTIADFEVAADRLSTDGVHGFSAFPGDLAMFSMIRTRAGAQPVRENGELGLTAPAVERGIDWYTGLVHEQRSAPPLAGNDSTFPVNQFIAGNTAMVVDGPWDILHVSSESDFDLGMAPLPAGPDGTRTLSAGSGFGIAKSCPVPEKAFAAIKVLTGEKVLTTLAAEGRAYPARPATQQAWLDNAPAGAAEALGTAAETAESMRTTPEWPQISTDLVQYGIPVFNGATPAEAFLAQVQSENSGG
ncbi:carbohydrate ABC transporter substrate-binding protein (CUT1 family) [Murinocardiopsis flavida]|uniref:Carbohydrate ABC transporter substrate-binding protein (CUT1 family) n=1 Tax=Murinocardiopsis flavida TaxID=645275 RepID=A0A2P8DFE2_9ACTN|nr:sugar ABC transporter substrate-binding protein [Murinocardiopsis flavida]PSK95935.1 carbohydrate ABC transporter substrate-binding protein (CUT1 family) [Murinocardiopsis flavida]